jgi:hypothetical protein
MTHPNLRPASPFENGNRVAQRHGFYARVLSPVELDEVEEIAGALRDLSPLDADALEPLIQLVAGQVWRRRKAYVDLEANGVVRARGKAAPILRDLESLERSILEGYKGLSLTPQAAASLNLTSPGLELGTGSTPSPERVRLPSGPDPRPGEVVRERAQVALAVVVADQRSDASDIRWDHQLPETETPQLRRQLVGRHTALAKQLRRRARHVDDRRRAATL